MSQRWWVLGLLVTVLLVVGTGANAVDLSWEDPEQETTETPTVAVVDGGSAIGKECIYEEDLPKVNISMAKVNETVRGNGNVTKLDLVGAHPDGVVESRPLRTLDDVLARLENMTRPSVDQVRRVRGRVEANAAMVKALDVANNMTRRRALGRSPNRHWEKIDGNLILVPDRNYMKLTGKNLTDCLSCLAGGEIFVIYPNSTNILRTKATCDLPGNIFASPSISIVYRFYFHLHECRQIRELRLFITEDILFFHPFSVYKNLRRPTPATSPLPKFSDVGNPIWREINRIVRFPFHRSLLRVYPRNFADARLENSTLY